MKGLTAVSNEVRNPGFFTKLFAKKDWRLVKKLDQKYRVFNTVTKDTISDGHVLTFYLFENQFGDRRIELVDSQKGELNIHALKDDDYAFRCDLYRDRVYGWVNGGYDADIPNYYSVEHKTFLDTLRNRKAG